MSTPSEPVSVEITLEEADTVIITQTPPADYDISLAGPQGPKGNVGPGVPPGGMTEQILKKLSSTDYDTVWANPSGGTLSSLTDVNLSVAPTNGQALVYDTTSTKWKPGSVASGGGSTPIFIGAKAARSTVQTIPVGGAKVSFTSPNEYDTSNIHDPVINPTRLTVPAGQGGTWNVAATWQWVQHSAATNRSMTFYKNGTLIPIYQLGDRRTSMNNSVAFGTASADLQLAAGDYIEFYADHDAGVGLDITATLEIRKVGGAVVAGSNASTEVIDTSASSVSTSLAPSTTAVPVTSGTFTLTPTEDILVSVEASALATNNPVTDTRAQGVFLYPEFHISADPNNTDLVGSIGPDYGTSPVARSEWQVVKTPLNNNLIQGNAMFYLRRGRTYKLAYKPRCGSGGPAITVTGYTAKIRTIPLFNPGISGSLVSSGSSAGGSSLLATPAVLNPTSYTSISTTSTTPVVVDPSLFQTFIAPASGRVGVRMSGYLSMTAASTAAQWCLIDGTGTLVPGSVQQMAYNDTVAGRKYYAMVFAGLAPGQSYTWKWAHQRYLGSGNITIEAGIASNNGPGAATMEVYDATVGGAGTNGKDRRWTPATASVSIDEFNDGTMDPAWVRVDGTGAPAGNLVWTEDADVLSASANGLDSGGKYHALMRPIGTPMVIGDAFVTCMSTMSDYGGGAYSQIGGLFLSDGITFGSGVQVQSLYYYDPTQVGNSGRVVQALGSMTGFSAGTQTANRVGLVPQRTVYLRVVMVAANSWRTDISPDGVSWIKGTATSVTVAPTYVGFALSSITPPGGVTSYEFLRRVGGVT